MGDRACWRCDGGKVVDKSMKKIAKRERKKLIRDNPGLRETKIDCVVCNGSGFLPPKILIRDGIIEGSEVYSSLGVCEEAMRMTDLAIKTTGNRRKLIAIIGAGIGGCALALALQRRGINVKIFEKDSGFDVRHQGYGLTMQQAGSSLNQLGLVPEGVSSTSHYVFKPNGDIIRGHFGRLSTHMAKDNKDVSDKRRFNLHIPRQVLRKRLINRLLPDTILWNYKLTSFEEYGGCDNIDGNIQMSFSNGDKVDTSLLVGADGIRSVIRQSIMKDNLNYLGHIVILGIAPCSHPLVRRRIFQTVDGITRWYCMPFTVNGDGVDLGLEEKEVDTTMWQLSWACDEEEAKRLGSDPALLLEAASKRVGGWHEPIPTLLSDTRLHLVSGYPVYDRELLSMEQLQMATYTADVRTRITILGDAAHPMSPFKGQGANQALIDALSLANQLGNVNEYNYFQGGMKQLPCSLESALCSFEKEMIDRSSSKVIGSSQAVKFLHSEEVLRPDLLAYGYKRDKDIELIEELKKRRVNAIDSKDDLDDAVGKVVNIIEGM